LSLCVGVLQVLVDMQPGTLSALANAAADPRVASVETCATLESAQ
jgi:hypothetical protein